MGSTRGRAAMLVAHAVPLPVSLLLVLVLAELLLPGSGTLALLGWVGVALWAGTARGERVVALLLMRARTPTRRDRWALAPVAAQLMRHGVSVERLRLRMGQSGLVLVRAVGRRTVVVSRAFAADVLRGRLTGQEAAAVVAHELGVMRAGLTAPEATLRVLLLPWTLWLTVVGWLWAAVGAVVGSVVRRLAVVAIGAVELWRGWAVDPVHLVAPAVVALAWLTYGGYRWWEKIRWGAGDDYLAQCGLAGTYAALLSRCEDRRLVDRATRLSLLSSKQEELVH